MATKMKLGCRWMLSNWMSLQKPEEIGDIGSGSFWIQLKQKKTLEKRLKKNLTMTPKEETNSHFRMSCVFTSYKMECFNYSVPTMKINKLFLIRGSTWNDRNGQFHKKWCVSFDSIELKLLELIRLRNELGDLDRLNVLRLEIHWNNSARI